MGREAEGGLGWGTHVNPWLINVNVWKKSVQFCKIISLQLIKINEKEKKSNLQRTNSRITKAEDRISEMEG